MDAPPKILRFILRCIVHPDMRPRILDELDEIYEITVREEGRKAARCRYRRQILRSLPFLIIDRIYWRIAMLTHYIKLFWRTILRRKGFTFINVTGLALGLSTALIIFTWIDYNLSYDRFHTHCDDIYQATWTAGESGPNASCPGAMGPALEQEFPEIRFATRIFSVDSKSFRHEDKTFTLRFLGADPQFLNIFSFPWIMGNRDDALKSDDGMIITQKTARLFFGDENPMNRIIRMEWWGRWLEFRVAGVVTQPPANSTLQFELLLPIQFVTISGMTLDSWSAAAYPTFFQMQPHTDPTLFQTKLSGYTRKIDESRVMHFGAVPLSRIHLFGISKAGPVLYVWIFAFIGVFILIIACINFINLSTAQAGARAREVGLRKVAGARQSQLIRQHFTESMGMVLISSGFALGIAHWLLPAISRVVGAPLALSFSPALIGGTAALILLTGLIAGLYPALILSRYQAAEAFKSQATGGPSRLRLGSALVILQFVLSILLLVGSLTISRQMNFIQHSDLGFKHSRIIRLPMGAGFYQKYETIREVLLANPDIQAVTQTNFVPNHRFTTGGIRWEGMQGEALKEMHVRSVDWDFQKVFDIKVTQGRFFSRDFDSDEEGAVLINETAVRQLGIDDPLGNTFEYNLPMKRHRRSRIIGVFKDFNALSLHQSIEPMFLTIDPWWRTTAYVRLRQGADLNANVAILRKTLKELAPEYPFEFGFLDDEIQRLYETEKQAGILVQYGTGLAILISLMGLLGMASYTAEKHTKEIGIRRTLGASVIQITGRLNRSFLWRALISNAIAWPLAWIIIHRWLANFAYRIQPGIDIFLISGGATLLIAMITVSTQTIKAAKRNPVETLKYE